MALPVGGAGDGSRGTGIEGMDEVVDIELL